MEPICNKCGAQTNCGDAPEDLSALCQACRDRDDVWKAFNDQLLRLTELGRNDPEQAIKILDDIYTRHMDRDHDGWLERSVRAERALIFLNTNRYDSALAELRIVEGIIDPDSDEFAGNKIAMADVLARSGKPREALDELEAALATRQKLHTGTVIGLLTQYAHIAKKEGWSVPSIYQTTFEMVVFEWGIQVPAEFVGSDLTQAILVAASLRRDAQNRYVVLLEELRDKPPDVRARLLREFIEAEPVGFFREQARRSLDGAGEVPENTEHQG
jgi:tetratricopeptide (TPR) repeat protein